MKTLMVMPTWNNAAMCGEAIRTLYEYTDFEKYGDLVVVENSPGFSDELLKICEKYQAALFRPGTNLGWMGSINYGLEYKAKHDLFTMCNDDVVFPQDKQFWPRTIQLFEDDPEVAGVGPISNYVMGNQFYRLEHDGQIGIVSYLIGFCATYRTSVLESVGPLDEALPGGDDLDLAIRVTKHEGWKLLCDRRNFLYHYGSVTGNRVHSDWDSLQAQHRTLNALIRKHGMKAWYAMLTGRWIKYRDMETPKLDPAVVDNIAKAVSDLCGHVIGQGAEIYEGSATLKEMEFLAEQVAGIEYAAEIGFNAGMSACAMLTANPKLHLVSFDEGKWPCVKVAETYLKERFGDRFSLVIGDSTKTFAGKFQFVLVDGGHDYETAHADISNCVFLGVDRIMVDDLQMPGVRAAWDRAIAQTMIRSLGEFTDPSAQVPRAWGLAEVVK